MSNHRYLYFTVFASGMTTLAVEMTASRLLDAYFGTSSLVWASIIGLILIYLAAGYSLGGRWADRSPHPTTFYTILAWGGFLCGLVPLVARPVLTFAAEAFDQLQVGILVGSFVGVLILFSLPITLLGMISPFAIRLALTDSRKAGSVSGKIYTISTFGSFIGTFLPSLLLIPLVGTVRTFLIFSLFLTLTALIGLWRWAGWRKALVYAWMLLVLVVLLIFGAKAALKTSVGQIYEGESAYNYVQVLEMDGYRLLRLNEGQGIHSVYHPTALSYSGPWEQFLAAPFFNPSPYQPEQVERIGIVGLAAGTTARQATRVYGSIPIDGWEIDPLIIEVGEKYFDMNMPNLQAYAQDGRWGLDHSAEKYTIIGIDAYRPPYIPPHLTTVEFFRIVRDHLTDDGVAVINVGRSPTDRSLIGALARTLGEVFPSVFVVDVPESFNSILYATNRPSSWDNLYANYDRLSKDASVHPLLIEVLQRAVLLRQEVPPSETIFTDDKAPIEWITNTMVLSYVFLTDMQEVK